MKETKEILRPYRARIDALDDELVALLARRFEIVREVAALKAQHGIPAVLPDRIEEVLQHCASRAGALGLDPDFVREVYRLVIKHACSFEDGVIRERADGKGRPGGTSAV